MAVVAVTSDLCPLTRWLGLLLRLVLFVQRSAGISCVDELMNRPEVLHRLHQQPVKETELAELHQLLALLHLPSSLSLSPLSSLPPPLSPSPLFLSPLPTG